MTAAPAIKGWCPTLLSPMQSGDGWLARVKPSAGCVSAEAARLIADAARRHGNGHIDLTSRANLQIRGLSPRSAQAFAETIIGAGLASANPSLEAIRNVMASPLGPDDPSAAFDSHAARARHRSHACRRARALGAAVQIRCPCRWRRRAAASQTSAPTLWSDRRRARLPCSSTAGRSPRFARPSTVAENVKALALAFLRLSAERSEPPRRMRALVMAVGEEAIFAEAGLCGTRVPAGSHART